jgi:hypothetical protein
VRNRSGAEGDEGKGSEEKGVSLHDCYARGILSRTEGGQVVQLKSPYNTVGY